MFSLSDMLISFTTNFFLIFLSPFFWLFSGIVVLLYRRSEKTEKKLFGKAVNSFWTQTFKSLVLGVLGGFLAAFILVLLGLPINMLGINYIFFVLVILALINLRFICFAYAGGVVAVLAVLTGYYVDLFPSAAELPVIEDILNIYLPGLLILVALLHLVESLLIFIGGHWGAGPVFFKDKRGRITGGFSLQRFWPLPLIIAWLVPQSESGIATGESIAMPEWWPILGSGLDQLLGEPYFLAMVSVMAILGYGDFAYSSTPREKTVSSSVFLLFYSVILMTMAFATESYPFMLLPACLFAPLGHEAVVYLGNHLEFSREPRYIAPEEGVKVLDIFHGSPAEEAGLLSEDIISQVNGEAVEDTLHFRELVGNIDFPINLTVIRVGNTFNQAIRKKVQNSGRRSVTSHKAEYFSPLGIILVPDKYVPAYVEINNQSPIKRIRDKLRRR